MEKTKDEVTGDFTGFSVKLSEKVSEISKGNASPEAYKEFYKLWIDTYKEIFGRQPSKEVFENFARSTRIHLNMLKSWIATFEKLSEKAREISKQTTDPEASKEFYDSWVKTYEKAFHSFFEDMPRMWMKSFSGSTGSV